MKIVIEIPEEEYQRWQKDGEMDALIVRNALVKGTPLPKGQCLIITERATNGDVIKGAFPNTKVCNTYPSFKDDEVYFVYIDNAKYDTIEMRVLKSWWNAPYKEEREEI